MGLLPAYAKVSGKVWLNGQEILGLPAAALAKLRGGAVSMIFQEPMAALDPVYTIGEQIAETIVQHEGCDTPHRDEARAGAAGTGEDPVGRAATEELSARDVGRHAAAGDDRAGAGLLAQRAAGGRADHRAGRDGADPDPAAAAPVAGRTRHGDRVRHPRRRRRGGDLRPHRGDVRRPFRRDRNHAPGNAAPDAPYTQGLLSSTVHGGMRGRDAGDDSRHARRTLRNCRRAARSRRVAVTPSMPAGKARSRRSSTKPAPWRAACGSQELVEA